MARKTEKSTKVRDRGFGTATARKDLTPRREPHWRAIEPGFALGYRRISGKGGTWIARHYTPATRKLTYKALGAADDYAPADGREFLTFAQAQTAARKWLADLARAEAGGVDLSKPYTVGDALDDYLTHYVTKGGRAETAARRAIDNLIRPAMGNISLANLTFGQVESFRDGLAEIGRRFRTKKGTPYKPEKLRANDTEQRRKRRATANRVFTFLRAALNRAYRKQKVASDAAWGAIAPFANVNVPRVRYLADDEALRLANACAPDMRAMVAAALMTGCRYGELVKMRAADFDRDNGTIAILESKSGKPRHVVLASEGRQFFETIATGKAPDAMLFLRSDGRAWKPTDQIRPLKAACLAAKISPAVSFHILRHTYASRLARMGVPMAVIASQLGHSDLRMTTRHYAHLSPGYVADTVRAAFGSMGLVGAPANVANIADGRKKSARGGSAH